MIRTRNLAISFLTLLISTFAGSQESARDLTLTRVSTPAGLPVYTGSHALVVGVNKYPNLPKTAQLKYAVNDAQEIKKTLVDFYGFPESNVVLLTDDRASLKGILSALDDLTDQGKVRPDDRILVYFSGHGQTVKASDGSDRGYLIPTDAKVNLENPNEAASYDATCLPMQEVWNRLDPTPAKHVAVIADACFSGLLTKPRSLFEENPLAAYLTMDARQAIAAGGKGQKTWETDAHKHGVFTYNLLTELRKRAKEKQRVFSMLDLFSSIQDKVVRDSRGRQIPQINQFFTEGQMLFFAAGDKDPGSGTIVDTNPAAQFGKLVVKSNPAGAKVFVDGVDMGVTPYEKDIEIEKNTKIKVRLEMEGYEPREKTVELKPKRETKVDERLKQIPVPKKKIATLTVVTSPAGATVTVDGENIGTSPLQKKIEIPGDKRVTVAMALSGYESAERSVELKPGKESKLNVVLTRQPDQPKRATLEVVTDPPGAEISIDGVVRGVSPVIHSQDTITPVSVSVRASLNGYEIAEQTATLDPSVPARITITLRKLGGTVTPGTDSLRLERKSSVAYSGRIRNVQFSPDGSKMAIIGDDGLLTLFDVASGAKIREFKEPLRAFIRISPDWRSLLYIYMGIKGANGEITVMVQDLNDPNAAKVLGSSMGSATVLNYAYASGGQLISCGQGAGGRAAISILNLATGKSDAFETSGRLQGAVISPDGNTVALFKDSMSTGQSTNLYLLRGSSKNDHQQVRLEDSNVGQGIFFAQTSDAVAVNAGRRTGATTANQRGMKIFETRDGRLRFSSARHVAIGFLAGGTRLLGWSEAQGGSMELFDAVSGKSLGAQKSARPWLSNDGRLLAVPVNGGLEINAASPTK